MLYRKAFVPIALLVAISIMLAAASPVQASRQQTELQQDEVTQAPPESDVSCVTNIVEDGEEGLPPDFRNLEVNYLQTPGIEEGMVQSEISFYPGLDVENMSYYGVYVYLFNLDGTAEIENGRERVRLDSKTFTLELDKDNDGIFEGELYTAEYKVVKDYDIKLGPVFAFDIPGTYIPGIYNRRIWASSEKSEDRIPDKCNMQLPPPPTQTPTPPALCVTNVVEDVAEGLAPDFKRLAVNPLQDMEINDGTTRFEISFYPGLDLESMSDYDTYVYLFNFFRSTQDRNDRERIRLDSKTFTLELDKDGDGIFEGELYTAKYTDGKELDVKLGPTLVLDIPGIYIPSIYARQIWAYSEKSGDRIPDNCNMQLPPPPTPTVTPTPTETATVTPTPSSTPPPTPLPPSILDLHFEDFPVTGIYTGQRVTRCIGNSKQYVWQVGEDASLASYQYTGTVPSNEGCGTRVNNIYPVVFHVSTVMLGINIMQCKPDEPGKEFVFRTNIRGDGNTYAQLDTIRDNPDCDTAPAPPVNVANNDFESGTANGADSWSTLTVSGDPTYTRVSDVKLSGDYAARISSNPAADGSWSKDGSYMIPVNAGWTYRLEVWGKVQNLTAEAGEGAYISAYFYDDSGKLVGPTIDSSRLTGTQDWVPLRSELPVPLNATKVRVDLRLKGTGTAWFDNISVTPTFAAGGFVRGTPSISLAGVSNYNPGDSEMLDLRPDLKHYRGWNVITVDNSSDCPANNEHIQQRISEAGWARGDGLVNIIRIDYRPHIAVPVNISDRLLWIGEFNRCVSLFQNNGTPLATRFIVGNEPNREGKIPPAEYAAAFNLLYTLKPGGVEFWATGPSAFTPRQSDFPYDSLEWMSIMTDNIAGTNVDAFAIHTYGIRQPPFPITCENPSQPCKPDNTWPYDAAFQFYRNTIDHIRSDLWSKPVYITEFNTNTDPLSDPPPSQNYKKDWINHAFEEIRTYNVTRGSKPEIRALIWFIDDPQGTTWQDFSLRKGKLEPGYSNGNLKKAYDDMVEEFQNPANRRCPTDEPDPQWLASRWKLIIYDNKNLTGSPVERHLELPGPAGSDGFLMDWQGEGPSFCALNDNFSVRFERRAYISAAGLYNFNTVTSDGVKLWVDGTQIMDHWVSNSSPKAYTASVNLSVGWHTILMDYFEESSSAYASLSWTLASPPAPTTPAPTTPAPTTPAPTTPAPTTPAPTTPAPTTPPPPVTLHLDVFVRGSNGHIYHTWFSDGWQTWGDLGAPGTGATSDPSAVSLGDNRIDLFVRGANNTLWHKQFDGQWGDWENLSERRGGVLSTAPDAASRGLNHIDVFASGVANAQHPDYAIYRLTYNNGTWGNWENVPDGISYYGPGATSRTSDKVDLFARNTEGGVSSTRWKDGGGWASWTNLGQPPSINIISGVDAVSWRTNNHLDAFVIGNDNQVWHTWKFDPYAWTWAPLGAPPQGLTGSDPSAVATYYKQVGSNIYNRIDLFAMSNDGKLWHRAFVNDNWGGWESLGKPSGVQLTGGPDAASWSIWQ